MNAESIHIRPAKLADAAEIVHLVQELAESLSEHSLITTDYAQIYLNTPDRGVLLATQGDTIIGLLSYSIRPDLYHAGPTALIEELVVSATARSKGVGSALLQAAETFFRQAGCVEFSLSVMPDNLRAIEFYRSHGLTDEAIYLEKHLEV